MFRFGDPGGRMYGTAGTSGANILSLWTSASLIGNWSVSASNGRNAGSCLRAAVAANQSVYLTKTLDSQATWGVAFGFRTSGLPGTGATATLAAFQDVATNQVELRLNPDGTLSVTRNGAALTGATSSFALSLNVYYHIEWKVKIDPSAGTVEVRVNGGAKIGPLTGLNTRNTSNSSANVFIMGPQANISVLSSQNLDWDDVIVWDTQATDANGFADIHDFIGDCGLVWLLPTGAGTTTQWTPDTGSNYARVNEATPDGDTSFVSDGTIGQIDTYAMADLAGTASSVLSVASIHYARKTDVSSRGMKAELRSGGGNTAYAIEIALGNSYQYFFSNWGQNPNNGAPTAWTVAAANAIEAGQLVSS
jgi:hypothetical protein